MCLRSVISILKVQNPEIKERAIMIMRSMMSKLKFKYSLKPDWIENFKKKLLRQHIPEVGKTMKNLQSKEDIPIVMRKNPNKLKLATQALDEYLIEDVINEMDLVSDVNMLSSEGYLKQEMSSDGESDQNSEKFVSFLEDENKAKREVEDKKLFMQRLRIEFTSKNLFH